MATAAAGGPAAAVLKVRSLRALCVERLLLHVSKEAVPEGERAIVDAALTESYELHGVTAFKAAGRVGLARGFLGLPRFRDATRRRLAAASAPKAAAVFANLKSDAAASTNPSAIDSACGLVEVFIGVGRKKRELEGADLPRTHKDAARGALKAMNQRLVDLRRLNAPPPKTFAATDARLEGALQQPPPPPPPPEGREQALADFFMKMDLRTHPTRR